MTTEKDKAALKPCPFCGGEAELHLGGNGSGDSSDGYIECVTKGCPVQPSTGVLLLRDECWERDEDELNATWNTRATLAPAVVEPVSGAVPDGWKLVPIDPSDEYAEKVCLKAGVCGGIFESVHSAMLATAPEPEKAQGDDPVGYIDANQLERWRVLRGTEYETAERCYMPWSKEPLKTDISDCCVPVYLKPLTERREPPADLSLDAMKALKRLEDGKIYDDYDDEDIEENAKAIETIRQALKGRISGVSKELGHDKT